MLAGQAKAGSAPAWLPACPGMAVCPIMACNLLGKDWIIFQSDPTRPAEGGRWAGAAFTQCR